MTTAAAETDHRSQSMRTLGLIAAVGFGATSPSISRSAPRVYIGCFVGFLETVGS